MRRTMLIAAFAIAPAIAAAQTTETRADAALDTRVSATPKIPAGFSAETEARLAALIEIARRRSLPAEPMTDRMAEGQAKGATEQQILVASATVLARLEASHAALVRAGRQQPTDEEITRGAGFGVRGNSGAALDLAAEFSLERVRALVETATAVAADVRAGVGLGVGLTRKP